jgi:hypothetical protein
MIEDGIDKLQVKEVINRLLDKNRRMFRGILCPLQCGSGSCGRSNSRSLVLFVSLVLLHFVQDCKGLRQDVSNFHQYYACIVCLPDLIRRHTASPS